MDFGFSDSQREVQNLARRIFGEQLDPQKLSLYDEYAQIRYDPELWRLVAEAGLLGVAVDERYGGMGFGLLELLLLIEEAGRTLAPLPLLAHCVGGMLAVQEFASEQQREQWLPDLVSGRRLMAIGLPDARESGVQGCFAGGGLQLEGSLELVPFGLQADALIVAVQTAEGTVLVVLDRAAAGLRCEPRQASSFEPQARVCFDGVQVAQEALLRPGAGVEPVSWLEQRLAVALCAHQLGAADAAMRMAAAYTSEREQFGVPVATFQAVGHRMADCYIDIECLRLACYQAGSLLHEALPAALESHIAKVWAGDVGHRVSYAAQHVHGGTGIDRDYPLWRYCLWLRHNEMSLGSSSEHLARIGDQLAAGEGLFA